MRPVPKRSSVGCLEVGTEYLGPVAGDVWSIVYLLASSSTLHRLPFGLVFGCHPPSSGEKSILVSAYLVNT